MASRHLLPGAVIVTATFDFNTSSFLVRVTTRLNPQSIRQAIWPTARESNIDQPTSSKRLVRTLCFDALALSLNTLTLEAHAPRQLDSRRRVSGQRHTQQKRGIILFCLVLSPIKFNFFTRELNLFPMGSFINLADS